MRKRERENPCGVCGHYHKYEEGEVCGICGHRVPVTSDQSSLQFSPFSSEILPGFLYLGSYDNASRCEFVKAQGISCILNTVPSCQNLYKNSFTYHCLPDDKSLPFDDAIQFLEQCEKDKARVLVHCMSGKNRSPAIVIAYLMKTRKWRLPVSYQWVKERRPFVEITSAVYESLQEYEQKIFQSVDSSSPALPVYQYPGASGFSFGLPKTTHMTPSPAGAASIFSLPLGVASSPFTFGGGQTSTTVTQAPFSANPANPSNGFNE